MPREYSLNQLKKREWAAPLLALVAAQVVFLCAPMFAEETPDPAKTTVSWLVRSQPTRIVNGAPILFRVKPPVRLKSLNAAWLDHDIPFAFDPATKTWFALAGAGLKTHPGDHPLLLTAETASGKTVSFTRKIHVSHARYLAIAITVPKQYTEPDPAQVEKIKHDQALKEELFPKSAPEREWSGRFVPPVEAAVSDQFGTERKVNGVTQSTHQGLDYRVPSGTPVSALNRGTVLLARPLFFEGNCVVVDHGQGLLSLYLHLSEIKVKEGDPVTRGQELGLSGATGRATGAHLHVAVRWQGIYLNPATLFSLRLP
ncbi:MAG TPA: M23 family metallopeptidase [Terriglobales bacterium]|nr:M23 family metallopeptidase [Terriglobales bacterium]